MEEAHLTFTHVGCRDLLHHQHLTANHTTYDKYDGYIVRRVVGDDQ